jgi:release factor glutamine methyltransferase
MLAEALRAQALPPGAEVLDLCTGSGAVAVAAAQHGAAAVTAVDVSRRALMCARFNARLNGVRVRPRRGDLFAAVGDRRFDAIVTNPPYLPSPHPERPVRGAARAWEGGTDGRVLLDRILAAAPGRLRPGGFVLVMQSSVCGLRPSLDALAAGGLEADVVARRRGPLGPLLRERASALWTAGLLPPGELEEELLVIRGRKPVQAELRGVPAADVGVRAQGTVA